MLDEIGELPLLAQTRLLRVLQERSVTPVGSHKPEPVDFWLVSASHRDLTAMVQAGTFREDLYYRICGWRQQLTPLRAWSQGERLGLIRRLLLEMDPALQLTPQAERQLLAHPLPGNVRQLKQALEVACVLAEGQGWIEPAAGLASAAPPSTGRCGKRARGVAAQPACVDWGSAMIFLYFSMAWSAQW